MKDWVSKLWHDPVWSKVIAAGLVAGIAALGTYFAGSWPAIGSALSHVWTWLSGSSLVANWLLLVLTICGLAVAGFLLLLAWTAVTSKPETHAGRNPRSYTSDMFLGLKWRWRYASDGEIVNVIPFCARCDYQIRPVIQRGFEGNTTTYPCEDCGHTVGPIDDSHSGVEGQVIRKIQKHLRHDTWPDPEA